MNEQTSSTGANGGHTLVLGIGNVLMGDEGVGVRVVEYLVEQNKLPDDVELLDGGTGSMNLLEPLRRAGRVVMIDATADGKPPGSITRLTPKFSNDYPTTITAHDIGLKDLLDALHLMGDPAPVTLFTVSINWPQDLGTELSPEVADSISAVAEQVTREC